MITKYIRKLTRTGTHSYSINVPKELVKEFKWRERQKIEIVHDSKRDQFVVRDWKK
jgi:bifunctional DNA-binding transcriptional regulator/antitoxin component of YhaV-PrlF toxin-antitoxin module